MASTLQAPKIQWSTSIRHVMPSTDSHPQKFKQIPYTKSVALENVYLCSVSYVKPTYIYIYVKYDVILGQKFSFNTNQLRVMDDANFQVVMVVANPLGCHWLNSTSYISFSDYPRIQKIYFGFHNYLTLREVYDTLVLIHCLWDRCMVYM